MAPAPAPAPLSAPLSPSAVIQAALDRYVPPADLAYLAHVGWTWHFGRAVCIANTALGCTSDPAGRPISQFSPSLPAAGPSWVGWITTHEAAVALVMASVHDPVASWAGSGGWAAQFASTPTARAAPLSPYDAAAGCLTRAWGAPMETPPDTPVPCPAGEASWVASQVAAAMAVAPNGLD